MTQNEKLIKNMNNMTPNHLHFELDRLYDAL